MFSECCTDELGTLHSDWTSDYHGITKGEGCVHVKYIYHVPNPLPQPQNQ